MKKWFFIILILSYVNLLFSQNEFFTDSLFAQQVIKFLESEVRGNALYKQNVDMFISNVEQDENLKFQVVEIFNQFYRFSLSKGLYINYIQSANSLLSKGQNSKLLNWNKRLLADIRNIRKQLMIFYNLEVNSIYLYKKLSLKFLGEFTYSLDENLKLHIKTGNLDLIVFYLNDSLKIENTSGYFDENTYLWRGRGGIVNWYKFEGIGDDINVQLFEYEINLNEFEFEVENVIANINYFYVSAGRLKGKFLYKFSSNPYEQNKNPKFFAYSKLSKPSFIEDVDFVGFLDVEGDKLKARGKFIFKRGGKSVFEVRAIDFRINDKMVTSDRVEVDLLLDSQHKIYHPAAKMMLIYDTAWINKFYLHLYDQIKEMSKPRVLTFIRGWTEGAAQQPFIDEYHKLKIYVSEMTWLFGKEVYFLKSFYTGNDSVYFESVNFYTEDYIQDFYSTTGVNYAKLFYQYLRKRRFPDSVHFSSFLEYARKNVGYVSPKFLLAVLSKMESYGWVRVHYFENYDSIYVTDISPIFYHIVRASLRKIYRNRPKRLSKYTDDFDIIRIVAEPKTQLNSILLSTNSMIYSNTGVVGILNLDTKVLRILHPKPFNLSKVRKVVVYTDTLYVEGNLNFWFDGSVEAGLTKIEGENFYFDYEDFKLDFNHIDKFYLSYLRLIDSTITNVLVTDKGDTLFVYRYRYSDTPTKVTSVIRNFKGRLYIDYPDNKSGLLAKVDDSLPTFVALTNSKIYYPNAPVKDTSKFHFLNYPFKLKNLTFLTKQNMSMLGMFRSSILKDLDSITLRVQPDGALGFRIMDTTKGFEIFGAARLVGFIQLDNSGLHSDGILKFLSTIVYGKFTLAPGVLSGSSDSVFVNGVSEQQKVASGLPAVYPHIVFRGSGEVELVDNGDSTQTMRIKYVSGNPFELYPDFLKEKERGFLTNASDDLPGELIIDYNGAVARGKMEFIDAEIISNRFHLDYDFFTSDTCKFVLKDSTFQENLFNTNNVSCYLDLNTRIGTFLANSIDNYVVFPKNKYIVYSDHFMWKINEGLIDIGGDLNDPKYIVVSSEAERDSLLNSGKYDPKMIRLSGTRLVSMRKKNPVNFQAAKSTFNPRKVTITAYDVPELDIADTKIYSSHPIVILIGGFIDTLHNARLKIGTYQHQIHNATVVIYDSKFYSASGYYTYPEDQEIFFNTIMPQKDTVSVGYAKLKPEDKVYLNNYFIFKGHSAENDITLYGDKKFLQFNGLVRILNECDTLRPRGFLVNTFVNPDTVLLPISYPIKGATRTLFASPIVKRESRTRFSLYNTFLTPAYDKVNDRILTKIEGYIYYNPSRAYYVIGPKDKVLKPDTALPMIAYDYKRCLIFADNTIDFGIKYGEHFEVKAAGRYRAVLEDGRNEFYNVILTFNFIYPSRILDLIIKDINDLEEVEFVEYENDKNLRFNVLLMAENDKEKVAFIEDYKLPNKLMNTISLGNVSLIWDKGRSSFRTNPNKIQADLLVVDNKEVDVKATVITELRYERNGIARMYLFIEFGEGVWYFFKYRFENKTGYLDIASYNGRAERIISQMEKKQRELEKKYRIGIAEVDELNQFLKLYKKSVQKSL